MRASHDLSRVSLSFTETNLVPNAGLLPAAVLAQRIGLGDLVDQRLRLATEGANSGAKALTVVGSMLAGGDSIDDTSLLRAGAAGRVFDDTRAPSTVGSWLRAHKWSNVRELDAVSRELLARLWNAGAGPEDLGGPLTIDLDSSIVPVYGRGKQGAAFGYTKVRGYHPKFATCATTGMVLFRRVRWRRPWGEVVPDRDGVPGPRCRCDRATDGPRGQRVLQSCRARYGGQARGRFLDHREAGQEDSSRHRRHRRGGVDSDPVLALVPGGLRRGRRRNQLHGVHRQGRHRRPVDRPTGPTHPGSQLALFTTWDYHAFVTNRPGDMLEAEADHRHAIVEQRIAELKSAGLAHLPSSSFMANGAWLALTFIAHNLGRAVGRLEPPRDVRRLH